jgi:katanin p60 ATPase-containing subunit A1
MPVDLTASIFAEYKRARKKADEAMRRGANQEAAAEYHRAARLMHQYSEKAQDPDSRQQRKQRADVLEKMARELAGMPARTKPEADRASTKVPEPVTETDYESEIIALISDSKVRWSDIAGLEETKHAIKTAYGLAMARKPQGVRIDSWRNILLIGPPGTGKTLLAAATAGSLEATFFNVKVGNLLSKYFGESTKIIEALYKVAKRMEPSVIFLEDFESLTPPRGESDSGAERKIVSALLAELDGLASKDDESYVLTMGATNLPWLLDDAILSRFQKSILVPLPDAVARNAIFEIHLTRRGHKSLLELATLVTRTEGYSGREINQLCQAAITHMTQRANPDLMAIVDKGQEALRGYEIRIEPLTELDFKEAFDHIHPRTNANLVKKHQDWLKNTMA